MGFNWWFGAIFTPLLVFLPLVVTLVVRARPDGDPDRYRRRLRRLVLATLAAAGLFVAVQVALHGDGWKIPLWPLFFPLWFALAVPAIVAKNPAWGHVNPPARTTRTATLVDRRADAPDVRWPHRLAWAVWGAALAAVLLRLTQPFEDGDARRLAIALGIVVLVGCWPPLLIPWTARRIHEEPEPLDAGGSTELRDAYRTHRRRRTFGLVYMELTMTVLLGAGMAALVWVPASAASGATLGLVLGGAGALIGLASGAFGTWMSFERARIAGILRDIEAREPTAA